MGTKTKILDIAMNLNRIGNWAADDFNLKRKRISVFLENTDKYIECLDKSDFSDKFKTIYNKFIKEYDKLKTEKKKGLKDPTKWAEEMMTWGNILSHRARFLT